MQKTHIFITGLFISSLLIETAAACRPPNPPRPGQENKIPAKVIASNNGQIILKMTAAFYKRDQNGYLIKTRNAYGEAFKTTADGQLQPLWKLPVQDVLYGHIKGDFYLSDDGIYLIEINRAANLDDKKAMTIYSRGKPARSYSPRAFMPQLNRLQVSTCGDAPWINYPFRPNQIPVALRENTISLQTIDGKQWSFDIKQAPKRASTP